MPVGNSLGHIIHPALHQALPGFYPSLATVQEAAESKAADLSIVETWSDVPGLIDIPCTLSPAGAAEMRTAAMTNVTITHVCDLTMYCPTITNQHQIIVTRADFDTAETFNVTGVKFDSQAKSTRLELEKVSN